MCKGPVMCGAQHIWGQEDGQWLEMKSEGRWSGSEARCQGKPVWTF